MRVVTQNLALQCVACATGMRLMVDIPSSAPPDAAKLVQDMLVAQCVGLCALQYYLHRGLAHEAVDIRANWEQLSHPVGSSLLKVNVALPAAIPVTEQQILLHRMQAQLTACQPFAQRRSDVVVTAVPSSYGSRGPA